MTASPSPSEDVEVLIYKRTEEWMRLWNSGQFEKVMELYAPDALYLPARHDPIFGRGHIREHLHGPMQHGATDFTLDTQFIQLAGELVYDVGRYSVSFPQPDGGKKRDRGRYLVIWQQVVPGDWRILVFAAWSSEQPWQH
ncbi:MAG TPA: DUF4440 domain-containing protein [Terriglobales bacterium]|jgi:uncharacterized protein (TIGR02246 family)|nr:DUF4440 domain-containing protein [Terriglobales bacterium]